MSKKIDDLKKELNKLSNRRAELETEAQSLVDRIEEKTMALGADLVVGREDERALAEVAKMQIRQVTTRSALNQLGPMINAVASELSELEKADAVIELEKLEKQAAPIFLKMLSALYELFSAMDDYVEICRKANVIAGRFDGLHVGPQARRLNMINFIREPISPVLHNLEKWLPDECAAAKAGRPERKEYASGIKLPPVDINPTKLVQNVVPFYGADKPN